NESSICFCPIAINDSRRTIDLGMAGRIGANLGVLSAPMFDDFSALETKQVEGDDRPREAAHAFVLRMKHDDVAIHEGAIDRNVGRRRTGDVGRERLGRIVRRQYLDRVARTAPKRSDQSRLGPDFEKSRSLPGALLHPSRRHQRDWRPSLVSVLDPTKETCLLSKSRVLARIAMESGLRAA